MRHTPLAWAVAGATLLLTISCSTSPVDEYSCPASSSSPSPGASSLTLLDPPSIPKAKRVILVVLENTDAGNALNQPFLKELAQSGAYLSNSHALARPSQPNYIGLTAGQLWGVDSNSDVELDAKHLGDLLEEKGKSWKAYAQSYPGSCFLGSSYGPYARKHVPFLSFENVQEEEARCARVVPATEFEADASRGTLPDFSLYIPDNENNGHDRSILYADQWLQRTFGARLKDPGFMDGTIFIVTFDEASTGADAKQDATRIYTAFYGAGVSPGSTSDACYTHYSVLKTIEETLGLGSLNQKDQSAPTIQGIWKTGSP